MKFSEIKLPSNRKFGLFFSLVFLLIIFYFYYNYNYNLAYFFIFLSVIFISITIIQDSLLLPLNKLWMRFGFILSIFISPIVYGLIFFSIFTPIGLFMKIIGRDELQLKNIKRKTYWKEKIYKNNRYESFENQF